MGLYEQIGRRIAAKQAEIAELKEKIRDAETSIRTWQEAQRLVPKDSNGAVVKLRPGSDLAKAEEAIKAVSTPLHIGDLVKAIGKEDTKQNRLALAGSISAYVRKNQVFCRPGPNTFGLIGLGHEPKESGMK